MVEEINNSVKILKQGGIILYPTDTIWGIGCDANNREAVLKIYNLKKRAKSKALIILIAEYANLYRLMHQVPPSAYSEMHDKKPTTIIFDDVKNIADEISAEDKSTAIRLVQDKFCKQLISKLGNPLVSTSANISGENNPKIFSEISEEIIKNVDYVVNLRQEEIMENPSRIIKINTDGVKTKIRE
jgi:L-threonylcarbamoyladenylate synthase